MMMRGRTTSKLFLPGELPSFKFSRSCRRAGQRRGAHLLLRRNIPAGRCDIDFYDGTGWHIFQSSDAKVLLPVGRQFSSKSGKERDSGDKRAEQTVGRKGNNNHTDDDDKAGDTRKPKNQQEFVRIRFEPGEWDQAHSDPLYLPPFDANETNKRVISEEDFNNRPTAGFSEEFATLADARYAPTWMNQSTKDQIYKDYVMLMEAMYEKEEGNVTSHEYVITVLARKYTVMPDRVAAIVELGHNEEQIKKKDDVYKYYHPEMAEIVDRAMNDVLDRLYAQYREPRPDPNKFSEIVLEREHQSRGAVEVGDIFDVDELEKQGILSDRERAQRLIDTKVYVEDDDPATVSLKVSKNCKDLIERQEKLKDTVRSPLEVLGDLAPFPAPRDKGKKDEGDDSNSKNPPRLERRKQWKWVCHASTAEERKKLQKPRNLKDYKLRLEKHAQNTIVNYEDTLRAATEEELFHVRWKPRKPLKEILYRGAKAGWIARKHRGQHDAWGPAKNFVLLPPEERNKLAHAGGDKSTSEDDAR